MGEGCVPDPSNCEAGERVCIDGTTPAVCEMPGAWTAQAPCQGDEVCVDGICAGRACAEAERNLSYLGCEYWAAELPNEAYSDMGGSTLDAPTGLVVANPDLDGSVFVSVFGPDGQIAELVGSERVDVPDFPPPNNLPPIYQDQDIASEVRDMAGQVFIGNINRGEDIEIPPGGIATLLLPRRSVSSVDSYLRRQTYRLTTDRPVAVYQFNPYCCNFSFTNDASILFPVPTLGTDYYYLGVPTFRVPFGDPFSPHSPAAIVVLGTEANTDVTVTLRPGARITPDPDNRLQQNGQMLSARIGPHEMLVIQSADYNPLGGGFGDPPEDPPDLSGARVQSSAPVAVFSSHYCAFYPQSFAACDHLEEQLTPTGTWGQDFVLVPTPTRAEGGRPAPTEVTYWKIVAREAGTEIRLSRPMRELSPLDPGYPGVPNCQGRLDGNGETITLDAGDYCEFGTSSPVALSANSPIMVMGIISGQESTGTLEPFGSAAGDPAIYLVPPDRQYRREYTFLAPDTYENDYLTIVTSPETNLELDGNAINLAQDSTAVPGSDRIFKHIRIADGAHTIRGDRPFGILVTAFDDFVSYAFTGGLNLTKR